MISLGFSIGNPWHREKDQGLGIDYIAEEWLVTSQKILSLQLTRWGMANLASFDLDLTWFGRDHAGPELTIELLGFMFHVSLQDTRHWNHDEGRFQTYEEAKAEAEEWAKGNHGAYMEDKDA
jgi:hypothetical protein